VTDEQATLGRMATLLNEVAAEAGGAPAAG
jgi:hypothetical protein